MGSQGSLVLHDVRSLFNQSGGLDISLYSAGMICADLLSRMQVGVAWRVCVAAIHACVSADASSVECVVWSSRCVLG